MSLLGYGAPGVGRRRGRPVAVHPLEPARLDLQPHPLPEQAHLPGQRLGVGEEDRVEVDQRLVRRLAVRAQRGQRDPPERRQHHPGRDLRAARPAAAGARPEQTRPSGAAGGGAHLPEPVELSGPLGRCWPRSRWVPRRAGAAGGSVLVAGRAVATCWLRRGADSSHRPRLMPLALRRTDDERVVASGPTSARSPLSCTSMSRSRACDRRTVSHEPSSTSGPLRRPATRLTCHSSWKLQRRPPLGVVLAGLRRLAATVLGHVCDRESTSHRHRDVGRDLVRTHDCVASNHRPRCSRLLA